MWDQIIALNITTIKTTIKNVRQLRQISSLFDWLLIVERLLRFYLPSGAVNLEESDQSRQLYLAYLSHRRVVYYLTFYRQINSFVITLNLSIIPTADWLINDIQYSLCWTWIIVNINVFLLSNIPSTQKGVSHLYFKV